MESLNIIPDIERNGGMPSLRKLADNFAAHPMAYRAQIHHVREGIEIGGLTRGTVEGNASISICIPLSDGRVVVAETTLALLRAAVAAIEATTG